MIAGPIIHRRSNLPPVIPVTGLKPHFKLVSCVSSATIAHAAIETIIIASVPLGGVYLLT